MKLDELAHKVAETKEMTIGNSRVSERVKPEVGLRRYPMTSLRGAVSLVTGKMTLTVVPAPSSLSMSSVPL